MFHWLKSSKANQQGYNGQLSTCCQFCCYQNSIFHDAKKPVREMFVLCVGCPRYWVKFGVNGKVEKHPHCKQHFTVAWIKNHILLRRTMGLRKSERSCSQCSVLTPYTIVLICPPTYPLFSFLSCSYRRLLGVKLAFLLHASLAFLLVTYCFR